MSREAAVFAAGTVNSDFVFGVPPLASGATLVAHRLLRTSGGRAANVAVMACRRPTGSAYAVTGFGAQESYPDAPTLEALSRKLRSAAQPRGRMSAPPVARLLVLRPAAL